MAFSSPTPQKILKGLHQSKNKEFSKEIKPKMNKVSNLQVEHHLQKLNHTKTKEITKNSTLQQELNNNDALSKYRKVRKSEQKQRFPEHVKHAPRVQRQYMHPRDLEEKLIERTEQLKLSELKLQAALKELERKDGQLKQVKQEIKSKDIKLNAFSELSSKLINLSVSGSLKQGEEEAAIFENKTKVGIKKGKKIPIKAKEIEPTVMEPLNLVLSAKDNSQEKLYDYIQLKLKNLRALIPTWEMELTSDNETDDLEVIDNMLLNNENKGFDRERKTSVLNKAIGSSDGQILYDQWKQLQDTTELETKV